MKKTAEFETFNSAMDTILRADLKAVREAIERESEALAGERSARGERKRGKKAAKKRSSASGRVSSGKD